jgi:hypothetical protein
VRAELRIDPTLAARGGTEAPEVGPVEDQVDGLARGAGTERVLATVLGDRGERTGVAKGPPERGPHVPPGREVVPLLRVHVHVPAVHRDHAREAHAPGRVHGGGAGRDRPMGVDHVGAALRYRVEGGPVLRLEIVSHDGKARELPDDVHPGLGHTAVRQVHRELHREPQHFHPVEVIDRRQGGVSRGHDRDRMTPPRQVAVDVMDIRGLGIGGVLGIPIGGTDDPQRRFGPPTREWSPPSALDLHSGCRHL